MERAKRVAIANKLYLIQRIVILLSVIFLFVPGINPARVSGLINKNMSFFTAAVSYSGIKEGFVRMLTKGWVQESTLLLITAGSIIACIGIVGLAVAGCMSLGEIRVKRLGGIFSILGSAISIIGLIIITIAHNQLSTAEKASKLDPIFPVGFYIVLIFSMIVLVLSVIIAFLLPKPEAKDKFEMQSKYKLFLLYMPFIALIFVFSYLPLWGWRYGFFDYKAGGELTMDKFVGLKWFTYLFQNESTRSDIVRVLRNTLAMSGLGIATSWCAMAFAIFLSEIRSNRFRRVVQTLTTIPNFISWVLVYTFAFAVFSSEGFIASIVTPEGQTATNYLMSGSFTWLKMLGWGIWKGLGWSAIIYIAAISGIDQQLYEAARVDGAGRFQRMWHITVPGLMPTYCVLLLLSIAGILSNGMDQYLVFENANNKNMIEVLDLYVFKLGINKGIIPLSTVIGMVKSIVSVILLFSANRISKAVRGESIV